VSNALANLREYFDDELLVQIGRKLEITPRGAALQDEVRDLLLRIDSTIGAKPEFDARSSDRTFRIFASDYTQMVLMPSLLSLVSQAESQVRFEFLPQISGALTSLNISNPPINQLNEYPTFQGPLGLGTL
jgi:LysR family transcriptional regulator, nod-box dependent transcriptional activator